MPKFCQVCVFSDKQRSFCKKVFYYFWNDPAGLNNILLLKYCKSFSFLLHLGLVKYGADLFEAKTSLVTLSTFIPEINQFSINYHSIEEWPRKLSTCSKDLCKAGLQFI